MTGLLNLGPTLPRPDTALWRALRDVPTSVLADATREVGVAGHPLSMVAPRPAFIGPAIPISAGSLAQWKALEHVQPGDVLVIACGDRRDRAEFGAVFAAIAQARGVAAIITDGLLRDREEIAELALPVMAAGAHPTSPFDPAPGSVNLPITLSGLSIRSGDLVAGDGDGIAVIPPESLGKLAERLPAQKQKEAALQKAMATGILPDALVTGLARIAVQRRE